MISEEDIPNSWVFEELSSITTLQAGTRPKGGVGSYPSDIPSLGGGELDPESGFKLENAPGIPAEYYESMNRGKIQHEDVLIVKDGATTGKTSFVTEEFDLPAAVNSHVFIMRPNSPDDVLPKYLYYFIRSNKGQNHIQSKIKGAAQGGINMSFTDGLIIPLPPLSEQERIVSVLDDAFESLDRVESLSSDVDALSKEFIQSHISNTLNDTKSDGKSLGEIVEFMGGLSYPKNEVVSAPTETSVPVVGIPAINEFNIQYEECIHVESVKTTRYNSRRLIEGDLLLIASNGSPERLGTCAVVQDSTDASFGAFLTRMRPIEAVNPKFLCYLMNSPGIQSELVSLGQGAVGLYNLSQKQLAKVRLLLPPYERQQEIANELDKLTRQLENISQIIPSLAENTDALRESILHNAFTGQLA